MATAVSATFIDVEETETGKLGLWLFILSEIMLFGSFFASYLSARMGNPDCALGVVVWPEADRLPGLMLATLNTVILLTSSYTMVRAITGAEAGDAARAKRNLLATILLGVGFLGVKGTEYWLKVHHGYYPGSPAAQANAGLSIFLSYYYLMTVLHALHVIVGLIWNGVILAAIRNGVSRRLAAKAEYAGLYWHFVDVVWVFLFPLLYLI